MKSALIAAIIASIPVSSALATTTTQKDLTPPVVTAFIVPPTVRTTTVPVTTFAASDNVAVTGYMITTTATKPMATTAGWSNGKSASYTSSTTGAITLYAWAKDAAGNVSAAKAASVVIDTTLPTVTAFTVPATVRSLTLPITTFTATDNIAVVGYMITLSPVKPLATASGWNTTKPVTFAVATTGKASLYAWVKDAVGNVSIPVTGDVVVDTTAPIISSFSVPTRASTLVIPVSSFVATDNRGVTGYLVTDSATAPSLTASGWSSAAPANYTVATTGVKKLYAWTKDAAGNISLSKSATCTIDTSKTTPAFTIAQTISDTAQRTTLAFDGLALLTGNLDAQSFFPPGKVADYTGFQYLRDNDPNNMGHNTSFLTRVANNVIYILNGSQFAQLQALAVAQQDEINQYGYKRFPLMKAFRRLIDNDIPTNSPGLNLNAVKKASRELYLIDGQISFDRAVLYSSILNSLDSTQIAYLAAMKGKGWNSWPDITNSQIEAKMQALPEGTAVAVMTYASDLFSWYAGSIDADVYFCPERHGTYYGGFYIKDAPAVGHEGYSISEQLTATAGNAISDSKDGYVTQNQATLMSSLVDTQRNNLYAGSTNIVQIRTQIVTLLRSLLTAGTSTDTVKSQVLALSETYGELDGENNYEYATVFLQVYKTLDDAQKIKLAALRKSIMSGTYIDGTAFDYSVATTPFLYSNVISESLLAPYISNTDYLFFEP